jgi:hypothetical protein
MRYVWIFLVGITSHSLAYAQTVEPSSTSATVGAASSFNGLPASWIQRFEKAATWYGTRSSMLPRKHMQNNFATMASVLLQVKSTYATSAASSASAYTQLLAQVNDPTVQDQLDWAVTQAASKYTYVPQSEQWQPIGSTSLVDVYGIKKYFLHLTTLLPFGNAASPASPPTYPGMIWENFDHVPLFGTTGAPVPTDVDQRNFGDCYLLSSLGTVAYSNPGLIESNIRKLPDAVDGVDVYRIRLYGVSPGDGNTIEPIDVDVTASFPTDQGSTEGDSPQTALWVALYEKAFAAYDQVYNIDTRDPNGAVQTGYRAIDQGGNAADVLPALTGKLSSAYVNQDLSLGQIKELLAQAGSATPPPTGKAWNTPVDLATVTSQGTAVCAGSNGDVSWMPNYDQATGLGQVGNYTVSAGSNGDMVIYDAQGHVLKTIITGHEYMVLGITGDNAILLNPWGQNDPVNNGDGYLPLELFQALFYSTALGTQN